MAPQHITALYEDGRIQWSWQSYGGRTKYLDERIVSDPSVMVGKPVMRGTHVTVEAVLTHLADNPHIEDVLQAYPMLSVEDVQACVAYAAAHPQSVRSARRDVALLAGVAGSLNQPLSWKQMLAIAYEDRFASLDHD